VSSEYTVAVLSGVETIRYTLRVAGSKDLIDVDLILAPADEWARRPEREKSGWSARELPGGIVVALRIID
jgi:hypothetical protein